jgi:hypothetical protein
VAERQRCADRNQLAGHTPDGPRHWSGSPPAQGKPLPPPRPLGCLEASCCTHSLMQCQPELERVGQAEHRAIADRTMATLHKAISSLESLDKCECIMFYILHASPYLCFSPRLHLLARAPLTWAASAMYLRHAFFTQAPAGREAFQRLDGLHAGSCKAGTGCRTAAPDSRQVKEPIDGGYRRFGPWFGVPGEGSQCPADTRDRRGLWFLSLQAGGDGCESEPCLALRVATPRGSILTPLPSGFRSANALLL